MKNISAIFFCFLLISTSLLFAQDIKGNQDIIEKKWALKISPQHFIYNTLKLEMEKMIKEKQFSLTFSPFYAAKEFWEENGHDKVWGLGAETMARLYFAKNQQSLNGFYTSFGINYHYYDVLIHHNSWKIIEEDGLEFLKYAKIKEGGAIHRAGILMLLGYQVNIRNKLLFDFYHGIGLKRSFSPGGNKVLKRFDSHFMNYGFSGIDPRIGIKVGFIL